MTASTIRDRHDLIAYLHTAMALEHATIPPYLTAYYSIRSTTNSDAAHIIRVVAVEEMLHLTLAANVLNAIGGEPDLTRRGFVPTYPAYLPDGEDDFTVDLRPFSPDAVDTFCKIERPGEAPRDRARLVPEHDLARPSLVTSPTADGMRFYSIGEFYAEIIEGLEEVASHDPGLFRGDPSRQVGPEYFFSGGGTAIPVFDLDSARRALEFIADQGEGFDAGIHDEAGELAHYYRFRQLQLGRYYEVGDHPDRPSGPHLAIDWHEVYPVKVSARLADYPPDSQIAEVARAFNVEYWSFLGLLTEAFTGQPNLLQDAIWHMFRLRDGINRLVRNPLPGSGGLHAAPTFEMPIGRSTPDGPLVVGEAAAVVTP
ncbi:ferritin-like protein [Saccharothrix sp. S26]|uniref:ferritin-like domain-containing protein n=1 Tax=Saccharothrix sp. S26 TaxID=2907215 RepID=UPI001F423B48|nr:ferritin-like protein [Saccharothrix sp. S26]MCE7000708.1 ferritin-like protein [Saccharothrix sp. S26]